MISKNQQMHVANVCYANIASQFAMFNNPKFRGENFTWEWWIDNCERDATLWMMTANVRAKTAKDKPELDALAKRYAREIATTLVNHLTRE